ncbi:molybdenum cofactor guanylyltransferase MobA [Rhizobium sp. Root482]|uniref:molybdenum cofactor guanylyltransferase MobA n=1 Tax=Rhizobium sp. Root482 TaxID=1736543 RepID=UPI0006F6EDB9|nr:molybdenum cofactor guanylyltransferase MobA [Rhizobium sp. Root482]KQY26792.1 molybdenum cofactor guanylyltransferase [Rhizobium sp. Root482]
MTRAPVPSSTAFPGVVLAGGRSSRMGRDKASLSLGGTTLLDRVIARLAPQTAGIGINMNGALPRRSDPAIAVFTDTLAGQPGPMAGVLSAMRHARARFPAASHVVTVPTDTPFFPLDLVARLAVTALPDRIAFASSGGAPHPVFALWPVELADALEHWLLTDGKRRVRDFIESRPMVEVAFDPVETAQGPVDPFFNINTPADLERAERWLPFIEDLEK